MCLDKPPSRGREPRGDRTGGTRGGEGGVDAGSWGPGPREFEGPKVGIGRSVTSNV